MSDELKALSRRFFDEAWDQGRGEALTELVDTNCAVYDGVHKYVGLDVYRQVMGMTRTAFPDVHFKIEDQIAASDKVVTRFTLNGTHKGPFMTASGANVKPTGKRVTMGGVTISRYQKGKLVEDWNFWDLHGLLQQISDAELATSPKRAGGE